MENFDYKPPVLMMAGTAFHFNAFHQHLQQVDHPENTIAFSHFTYSEQSDRVRVWFDRDMKTVVHPDFTKGQPANVVCLEFDHPVMIDPIGMALNKGQDPKTLLKRYPAKPKHHCKMVPVRLTSAKHLIDEYNKHQRLGRK